MTFEMKKNDYTANDTKMCNMVLNDTKPNKKSDKKCSKF